MKIRIILFLACLVYCQYPKAQNIDNETGVVYYVDSVSQNMSLKKTKKIVSNKMSQRTENDIITSRLGKIIASYPDNYFMTDGVKHCLKLAMDIWEEKININIPISFYVIISEDMDPNIAISTQVTYSRKSRDLSLPDNLYIQEYPYYNAKDTITINACIDWNSSWQYDDGYNGTVCLLSGFLRHIGHILGFGSSVVNRVSTIGFAVSRTPSIFDKLIYNGEQYLYELKNAQNQDFESFFSKDIKLKSDIFDYDMYDTDKFVLGRSGIYFSLGYENLLEYPIHDVSKMLPINHETLNVLKYIGWDVNQHDKEILCDSTDILGYGSAYKNYNFTLNDTINNSIVSATWEYQIYNNLSHSYKTLNTYEGKIFHIEPHIISNSLDEYQCVQARVTAKFSEKEYHFPLTLETRPFIEDVCISNIKSTGNGQYQFNLLVRQHGATSGTILVSDDSGSIHEYNFNGNIINVSGLIEGLNAYIDISLENEYGSSSRLIQGCFYSGDKNILSIQSKNNSILTEKSTQIKTLHDQDVITMKLPDNLTIIADSIKWFLCVDDKYKELCTQKSKEKSYTFKVTQGALDFKYGCDSEENKLIFIGGNSWNNHSWQTDGLCHFIAKIYCHDNNGQFSQTYRLEDIKFDVLPSEPIIKILDVWANEDDYNYPYAKISFNITNYDYAAVYVYVPQITKDFSPTNIWLDTTFVAGTCEEYIMALGEWTNRIYCEAYNSYGYHKGHMIGLQNTGVENNETYNPTINIYKNTIDIKHNTEFNIRVYTIDGKIIDNKKTKHYFKNLSSGHYIIILKDIKSKSSFIKKIIIQ